MDTNEESKTSKTKAQNVNVNLKCRFYEKEFPEVEELVMVEIRDLVENGAYAKLLEYNDKEGMIAPNEFTAARMKSINKIFKVGTQEVVMVLRVDTEKGYIDLSKKKVNVTDINQCKEKFRQGKLVHTILATVAAKNNIDLEKLYQDIAWPLAKKFGTAYEALRCAVMEPDKIFKEITINDDLKSKLLAEIKRRLAPQPVKIRADFEMTCFSYEGVEGIKAALREGKTKSTSTVELQFQVLSAPVYMAIANTPDKNEGIKIMKEALALIEAKIKEKKGSFLMKEEPRVVGDKGEKEIEQLVQQLEKGKEVVSSDDEDNDEAMNVDVDGVDDDNDKKKDDDEDDDDEDEDEDEEDDKKEK